jgi:hypothetical protein
VGARRNVGHGRIHGRVAALHPLGGRSPGGHGRDRRGAAPDCGGDTAAENGRGSAGGMRGPSQGSCLTLRRQFRRRLRWRIRRRLRHRFRWRVPRRRSRPRRQRGGRILAAAAAGQTSNGYGTWRARSPQGRQLSGHDAARRQICYVRGGGGFPWGSSLGVRRAGGVRDARGAGAGSFGVQPVNRVAARASAMPR